MSRSSESPWMSARSLLARRRVQFVMSPEVDTSTFDNMATERVGHQGLGGRLSRFENTEDRGGILPPGVRFGSELLAASRCQPVKLCLAVVVADAPLGLDRARSLQPMQ